MGKPSRTQLSSLSSQQSVASSDTTDNKSVRCRLSDQNLNKKSSQRRMSINKIHKLNEKKKQHKLKQNKIDKLKTVFNKLRNESALNINRLDNDVIVLDDSVQDHGGKRKLSQDNLVQSNKCIKLDEPVIVPDDDVLIINSGPCGSKSRSNIDAAPIECSTPIKRSKSNNNNSEAKNFNADVANLTKEINQSSYLTIDLTTESSCNKTNTEDTVIDLENTDNNEDCTVLSISNASSSMSGDSDVTVICNNNNKKKKSSSNRMSPFVNGIAKLNSSQKGKLLELITKNIFSGCNVPKKVLSTISMVKASTSKYTETVEDVYIKEVILGEKNSRNSIGSNIYNPQKDPKNKTGLRLIVIDGSNVALGHTKGAEFSVKGLKICIDYFLNRGHAVKAFVPRFRCKWGKSTEPRVLDELERKGLVVYTPSREVFGRFITSYDDRYIVQCAAEFDGIIVSQDNFRDLLQENPRWRFVIEKRLLPFTWVDNMIMFPRDPLGRYGPKLENFLRH